MVDPSNPNGSASSLPVLLLARPPAIDAILGVRRIELIRMVHKGKNGVCGPFLDGFGLGLAVFPCDRLGSLMVFCF